MPAKNHTSIHNVETPKDESPSESSHKLKALTALFSWLGDLPSIAKALLLIIIVICGIGVYIPMQIMPMLIEEVHKGHDAAQKNYLDAHEKQRVQFTESLDKQRMQFTESLNKQAAAQEKQSTMTMELIRELRNERRTP